MGTRWNCSLVSKQKAQPYNFPCALKAATFEGGETKVVAP